MVKGKQIRNKAEDIHDFIKKHVQKNNNIVALTAEHFGISKQAVSQHIRTLIDQGTLEATGNGKSRRFRLKKKEQSFTFTINKSLNEDDIWRENIAPLLTDVKPNVRQILNYACTEMINNVIDHSKSKTMSLVVEVSEKKITVRIHDYGIGIFNKIQSDLQLNDPRQALLELAKGKFTTDPKRHSGEGIFFTSRMMDKFVIYSYDIYFSHDSHSDWIVNAEPIQGTLVVMELPISTQRTSKDVFDRFSTSPEDMTFDKTIVPVELAKVGDEFLVSRSQAKRLLTRFERFKEVVLDFKGVSSIGQAFADEIFRVFANEHPEVQLHTINTEPDVQRMINRAKKHF